MRDEPTSTEVPAQLNRIYPEEVVEEAGHVHHTVRQDVQDPVYDVRAEVVTRAAQDRLVAAPSRCSRLAVVLVLVGSGEESSPVEVIQTGTPDASRWEGIELEVGVYLETVTFLAYRFGAVVIATNRKNRRKSQDEHRP